MSLTLPLLWLSYAGIGALAGLLAGAFGIGGGIVVIPALLVVFGLQELPLDVAMRLAVGTSLATIVITGCSSAFSHYRNGNVLFHRVLQLLPGLLSGAVLGVFIANSLSGSVLRAVFGSFLILLALHNLSGWPRVRRRISPSPAQSVLAGGVIGSISALFGIGGGTLCVPWLTSCGESLKQAIGTSATSGIPSALVGMSTFIVLGWETPGLPAGATGYVLWPALLGMVCTSIPFARLGAYFTHIAPTRLLQRLFSLVLLGVGARLLLKHFF